MANLRIVTPTVMDAGERAVRLATIMLARHIKTVSLPGSGLKRRSGALSTSIVAGKTVRTLSSVVGRVIAGQGLPYARIHEYGGTITPKHAQFLAIPVGDAKGPGGVQRFGPWQAESEGYRTFVRKGIIFGSRGKDDATPLFILRRSVTIPARPYFAPGIVAKRNEVRDSLARAIQSAIAGIG